MAALTDHADLERRVWIDCFAVRQWPGSARRPRRRTPPPAAHARADFCAAPSADAADLCFDKVVRQCTSFVIACQAFETRKRGGIFCLGDLTAQQMMARQVQLLPDEVRKSIAFLRIW